MRGPRRRVTVAGRRRHTLVMNAPDAAVRESGVAADAIGTRYQKSGSSCAPHCRLKRYVPALPRRSPEVEARETVGAGRSDGLPGTGACSDRARSVFEQAAHGTISVSLNASAISPPIVAVPFLTSATRARDPKAPSDGAEEPAQACTGEPRSRMRSTKIS